MVSRERTAIVTNHSPLAPDCLKRGCVPSLSALQVRLPGYADRRTRYRVARVQRREVVREHEGASVHRILLNTGSVKSKELVEQY